MRKTTVTIKRPEGHIETVDVSDKFAQGLSDQMFQQVKKATKDAGRGECLSYKIEDTLDAETKSDIDAHEKKCRWFEKHGFNSNDIN